MSLPRVAIIALLLAPTAQAQVPAPRPVTVAPPVSVIKPQLHPVVVPGPQPVPKVVSAPPVLGRPPVLVTRPGALPKAPPARPAPHKLPAMAPVAVPGKPAPGPATFPKVRAVRLNPLDEPPGMTGGGAVKNMEQMPKERLEHQEAMQQESRKFQTLSNASKARHEAAKAAIRNMK